MRMGLAIPILWSVGERRVVKQRVESEDMSLRVVVNFLGVRLVEAGDLRLDPCRWIGATGERRYVGFMRALRVG